MIKLYEENLMALLRSMLKAYKFGDITPEEHDDLMIQVRDFCQEHLIRQEG